MRTNRWNRLPAARCARGLLRAAALVLAPLAAACAAPGGGRFGVDRLEHAPPAELAGLPRFTFSGTGVDFAACPTQSDWFRRIRLAGYDTFVVSLTEREAWPRRDVERWAKANGLRYFWIPLGREAITRARHVAPLAEALAGARKALLTCATGARVKALYACWLHDDMGLPADRALARARQLGLRGARLRQAEAYLHDEE